MVVARDCSSPADIDFQGKHSGEHFQFQFHQHWVRMLWPCVKAIVWNGIIFGIGYATFIMTHIENDVTRRLTLMLLTLFFVLSHLEFITKFYRYLLYVVVVTDKKIHRIKKTLLMTDDHFSIDLWMTQDLQKCQNGVAQNILGFGSIIVEAQETVMRMHFVPGIIKKYEKVMHLRESARSKMGYVGGEKQKAEK